MKSIALLGPEAHKDRWLPAMARLEAIEAFSLIEPEHGSDSVALETSARRDGDKWVLDGAKLWTRQRLDHRRRGRAGKLRGGRPIKASSRRRRRLRGHHGGGQGSVASDLQAEIRLEGVCVSEASRLPGAERFKAAGRVLVRPSRPAPGERWDTPSRPTTRP